MQTVFSRKEIIQNAIHYILICKHNFDIEVNERNFDAAIYQRNEVFTVVSTLYHLEIISSDKFHLLNGIIRSMFDF